MRILLVTSFGFPHVGGLSKYMQSLKAGLEARGHYVEVLSLNRSWTHYQLLRRNRRISKRLVDNYIRRTNYRAFHQSTAGMPINIRNNELRRRGLELAARRLGINDFDVIHTQDVTAAMALARVGSKRSKRITTIHGIMAGETMYAVSRQGNLRPRVWRYLYALEHYGVKSSSRTIVPAHWLRRTYQQTFHISSRRLVTIPHGINPVPFSRTHGTQLRRQVGRTVPIIFNGQRLEPYKGHRYLIKALSPLRSHRWHAYIAGSGTLRSTLTRLRNQQGLHNRVTFLGSRGDIPSLLLQSDLVVVPSYVETFGLAVIEAQLAGKPVVGFRTTGVAEIVQHGTTGLLSPVGDISSLHHNIKRLLTNPSLRRRMGRTARRRALQRWTVSRMVTDTLRLYRSTPKGFGNAPPDNLLNSSIQSARARSRLSRIYGLYRGHTRRRA